MVEVQAKIKYAHISPKKVQPLLRDLRGRLVEDVLSGLKYSPSKAGKILFKLINSAVANAANNYNLKPENLKIKKLFVDSGPQYKRYWLRSHGSSDVRLKRTSHITTSLEALVSEPDKIKPITTKTTKNSSNTTKVTKNIPQGPTKLTSDEKVNLNSKSVGNKKTLPRTTNK